MQYMDLQVTPNLENFGENMNKPKYKSYSIGIEVKSHINIKPIIIQPKKNIEARYRIITKLDRRGQDVDA